MPLAWGIGPEGEGFWMWGPSLTGPRGSSGVPAVWGGAVAGAVPGVEGAWELEGAARALGANEGAVPSPGSQEVGRAGHLARRGKVDRRRGWSWAEDPGPEWAGHLQSLHSSLASRLVGAQWGGERSGRAAAFWEPWKAQWKRQGQGQVGGCGDGRGWADWGADREGGGLRAWPEQLGILVGGRPKGG